ncbi:MAG: hypothetical protein VXY89_09025 [SAR324 cluster bacterium]|nr:hypothetical protein [SAR324 cluster bacterium]
MGMMAYAGARAAVGRVVVRREPPIRVRPERASSLCNALHEPLSASASLSRPAEPSSHCRFTSEPED